MIWRHKQGKDILESFFDPENRSSLQKRRNKGTADTAELVDCALFRRRGSISFPVGTSHC